MNLKERARKLKDVIPAIFLSLKDGDTPLPRSCSPGSPWRTPSPPST